jgi:hypothetical protein
LRLRRIASCASLWGSISEDQRRLVVKEKWLGSETRISTKPHQSRSDSIPIANRAAMNH